MKHLLISRQFPPAPTSVGGIGTYTGNIARLLAERGETVHVIAQRWPGAPKPTEEDCDGRLVIHRVFMEPGWEKRNARTKTGELFASDFPPQAFAWEAALLAEKLVDSEGIELIEGQDWEAPLFYFQQRRAGGNRSTRQPPCLVHLHSPTEMVVRANNWDSSRPDHATAISLEAASIQASDGWVCPSNFLARQAETAFGISKVGVVPYPVTRVTPLPRESEIWRRGTILFIGRLEPRKGVLEWIEAACEVARRYPEAHFEIVGPDSSLSGNKTILGRLRETIPDQLQDRFVFRGESTQTMVLESLARARIAVVPSRWDNFPYTCVEAMASGLPIISTQQGGMAEMLVDGETGWLTETATPEELAAALERALQCSTSTLSSMGAKAAETIGLFCDPDRVVGLHLDLRSRLLAKGANLTVRVPHPTKTDTRRGFVPSQHLSSLRSFLSIPSKKQLAAVFKVARNPGLLTRRAFSALRRDPPESPSRPQPAKARNPLSGMRLRGEEGLVSVVLIFLNGERFLAEAIESILAQTYENWELFLVDDGSAEPATAIARDYADRLPDKVFYLEHSGHINRGMSASRNLGIRNSRGQFVAMMDADDVWLPHKLQRQVAILRAHSQVGMIYGGTKFWYSWTGEPADLDRDYTPNPGVATDAVYLPSTLSVDVYPFGNGTTPFQCDTILRREALLRVGGAEEEFKGMFEDTILYHKVFLTETVYVSSECWDLCRVHPGSLTAQARDPQTFADDEIGLLQWLNDYPVRRGIASAELREAFASAIDQRRRNAGPVPWSLRVDGGAQASLKVGPAPDHVARLEIARAASLVSHSIQLNLPLIPIQAEHRYTVSFEIRADRPRGAYAGVARTEGSWDGLGWYEELDVTTGWRRVASEFVATGDATISRLHLDLGLDPSAVEVRYVTFAGTI